MAQTNETPPETLESSLFVLNQHVAAGYMLDYVFINDIITTLRKGTKTPEQNKQELKLVEEVVENVDNILGSFILTTYYSKSMMLPEKFLSSDSNLDLSLSKRKSNPMGNGTKIAYFTGQHSILSWMLFIKTQREHLTALVRHPSVFNSINYSIHMQNRFFDNLGGFLRNTNSIYKSISKTNSPNDKEICENLEKLIFSSILSYLRMQGVERDFNKEEKNIIASTLKKNYPHTDTVILQYPEDNGALIEQQIREISHRAEDFPTLLMEQFDFKLEDLNLDYHYIIDLNTSWVLSLGLYHLYADTLRNVISSPWYSAARIHFKSDAKQVNLKKNQEKHKQLMNLAKKVTKDKALTKFLKTAFKI